MTIERSLQNFIETTARRLARRHAAPGAEQARLHPGRLAEIEADVVAAEAAKSELVALVSRELRAPVDDLLQTARALRQSRLDKRQAQQTDRLIARGQELLALFDDLLDIASLETGSGGLQAAPFELRELLQACLEGSRAAGEAKGLTMAFDVDPGLPGRIVGDARRIRKILEALLANAVSFTEEGYVRLEAKASAASPQGAARLEITVADSGVGLSKAQQEQLFEACPQTTAIARRFGERALPLPVAQQLAASMGGAICVDSAPGAGSEFCLHLTAALAPTTDNDRLAGRRVLVLADSPAGEAGLRAMLEPAGAAVEGVATADEALERMRQGAFDVVVMDMRPPRPGATALVRRIRGAEDGRAKPSVIGLAAEADGGQATRLRAAGCDAVLAAPVASSTLVAAVAEVKPRRGPRTARAAA